MPETSISSRSKLRMISIRITTPATIAWARSGEAPAPAFAILQRHRGEAGKPPLDGSERKPVTFDRFRVGQAELEIDRGQGRGVPATATARSTAGNSTPFKRCLDQLADVRPELLVRPNWAGHRSGSVRCGGNHAGLK